MARTIRIVHPLALPPFAEARDGRSEGMVVDIVRAAVERARWQAAFLAVPFEQVEAALVEGLADLSIPIAITAERRQRFDFSEMLLMSGGSLYVRAGEATPDGLAALAGKVLVTPRTGPLAGFIAKTAPSVKLVVTSNYEESLAKLVGGEADAAALNHQAGAMMAAKLFAGKVAFPERMFLELPFAAAVLKGRHGEAIAAVNAGLAVIKEDGGFDEICARWTSGRP